MRDDDFTCAIGGNFPNLPPTAKPHNQPILYRSREPMKVTHQRSFAATPPVPVADKWSRRFAADGRG
jgi:hypothetical protein